MCNNTRNIILRTQSEESLQRHSELSWIFKRLAVLKKAAFTLAEVLITLGIIGVVAAITLPPLVKNYQKQVWVNQLRKSTSMFTQGYRKWLADEGADILCNTKIYSTEVNIYSAHLYPEMGYTQYRVKRYFDHMKKYFNIVYIGPIEGYSYRKLGATTSNSVPSHVILLSDGTMFFNYSFSCGINRITLDLNGKKGPNTMGRDIFIIGINEYGFVVPIDDFDSRFCNPKNVAEHGSASGYGCYKKILEDKWKMNY